MLLSKNIPLIVALLLFQSSFSQKTDLNSLNTTLKNSQTKIDSAKALINLSKYYSNKSKKKFSNYIKLLDSVSQKINDPHINGTSHKLNSVNAKNNRDYELSAKESELAVIEFIKTTDTLQINQSLYALFESYRNLRQIEKVKEKHKQYQELLTPEWEFEYHYQLARYYLGQVYMQLKDYKSAISNITIALEKLDPKKNYTLYGSTFSTLGEIYKNKKEHSKAIALYDSAIVYYKVKNRPKTISKVLSAQSISYLQLKKFDKAKSSLKQAIQLHIKEKDERALTFAYSRLGSIFFYANKQSDSSVYYMRKSLELAKKYKIKTAIKASHYNLSNFLSEQGNYKEARNQLYQAYKYADTLYDEKLNTQLKSVEAKLQKAEDDNIMLKQEQEIQEQKTKLRSNQLFIVVFLLIITILGSVLGYIFIKRRQKRKEQEQLQEAFKNGFSHYLNGKYNLKHQELLFWEMLSNDATESELAEYFSKSKDTIKSWRKKLYTKLNAVDKVEDNYTKVKASNLYKKEQDSFKNR